MVADCRLMGVLVARRFVFGSAFAGSSLNVTEPL
jgi:hypothetical protein